MDMEAPKTAKALLATGILAGERVRYMKSHQGKVVLTGTISSRTDKSGVVCDCNKCEGKKMVNISTFEKHADSPARRPSEHIYLDNGKNLHEVVEAGLKSARNGGRVSEALHKSVGLEPDTECRVGLGLGLNMEILPHVDTFSSFEDFSPFFEDK